MKKIQFLRFEMVNLVFSQSIPKPEMLVCPHIMSLYQTLAYNPLFNGWNIRWTLCLVCSIWYLRCLKNKHSWRIPTKKDQCLLFKIKTFSALQDHKSRSVQFRTCVKYVKLYASCELHRPAFMTLEPIRFC